MGDVNKKMSKKPKEQRLKTATINIRVLPDIKEVAEERATERHQTLTQYLEWLILQDT